MLRSDVGSAMKYQHLSAVSELQLGADLGGFLFVLDWRKFFCLTVAYIQSLHCSIDPRSM